MTEGAPRTPRIGVIGAGRWGKNCIRTLLALPDAAELVLVASRNPETRSLVPNGCRVVYDWRDAFAVRPLDGVVLATPPELHVPMAEAAIGNGLGVFVEKPLSYEVAEAERLLEYARSRDALVVVDHTQLFSPAFRALVAAVKRLGPPRWVASKAGNPPPPFDDPVLFAWGSHDVAMCLDLLGAAPSRLDAVVPTRRKVAGGVAESVRIELEFPAGTRATLEVGNVIDEKTRRFAVQFASELWVYDDRAAHKLVRWPGVHAEDAASGPGEPVEVGADFPLTVALRTFCGALREGSTDRASLELGVDVVRVLSQCQARVSE